MELGYYNANESRSYPFSDESRAAETGTLQNLPNAAIVDFRIVLLANAGFVSDESRVWLSAVARSGNTVTFTVQTSSPGISNSLVFTRTLGTSKDYALERLTSAGKYSAFMVTGSLDLVAASLPDGSSWVGELEFEPGTTINLSGNQVTSVNLLNEDRVRVEDDECQPIYDFDVAEHYVLASGLTGDIRLSVGANCTVTQNNDTNTLLVTPRVGTGSGLACEEIKLFDEEAPPEGRTLLDGSLSCFEVMTSINGLSRKNIPIIAGPGVSVTTVPSQNKVRITIGTDN